MPQPLLDEEIGDAPILEVFDHELAHVAGAEDECPPSR